MTDTHPLLSVVVVTYNEADRIDACLESILSACREVGPTEVVVVDGGSTDGTVAAAREYPVTVLRTDEETVSSPASGRYVGTEFADGRYLLFVDGDTCVADGWLADAVDRLGADPALAGVGGHFNDVPEGAEASEVDDLWRVVLYDAEALASVGGFDPYLESLEDVDLGFRFRLADYRLVQLPVVVGRHPDQSGIGERVRRWKSGFYDGNGEVIRKYADEPRVLLPWLVRMRLWFGSVGWLALGALAARDRQWTERWLLGTGFLLGAAVVERDTGWLTQKLFSFLVLRPAGLTRGLLRYPADREYPVDTVEVVDEPADPVFDAPPTTVEAGSVQPGAAGEHTLAADEGTAADGGTRSRPGRESDGGQDEETDAAQVAGSDANRTGGTDSDRDGDRSDHAPGNA